MGLQTSKCPPPTECPDFINCPPDQSDLLTRYRMFTGRLIYDLKDKDEVFKKWFAQMGVSDSEVKAAEPNIEKEVAKFGINKGDSQERTFRPVFNDLNQFIVRNIPPKPTTGAQTQMTNSSNTVKYLIVFGAILVMAGAGYIFWTKRNKYTKV